LGVPKYLLCLGQEVLSGRREFQLLVTAIEKGRPNLDLEVANLPAERRLRYVEMLAAWVMFSASAAATKYRKWRSSMEPLCLTIHTH